MLFDNSGLLEALHQGIFETPMWSTFLDRLRARANASYVNLIFRPVGENEVVELFSSTAASPQYLSLLKDKFLRDPLPYHQMREGRVYAIEEIIDANDPVQKTFYDQLIAPLGVDGARMVRVTEPSGADAWMSCVGSKLGSSVISSMLTSLVPHVRIALRTFVTLERERFRTAVTSEAIRRLNFGWLSVDAQCRVVDMAPYMEAFFQRSSVIRKGRYDRLTPASPEVDRQLMALVKQFAADASAIPKAINLSRDPLVDMLVSPAKDRLLSALSQPVAIIYFSGDRLSQADRCEQLADLFGLTLSEARLAWAISQGMTIAEAAEDLGLTLETARNYSKKIYAKMGARGQVELVRNVLTSVLAFT